MSDYRDRVLRAVQAFYDSPKAKQPPEEKKKRRPKPKLKPGSRYADVPTEAHEQVKLAGLLNQLTVNGEPILWFHVPNESGGLGARSGYRRKQLGVLRGVSDILILTPGPLTGTPTAIELKRVKYSSTSPEQLEFLRRAERCGWGVHICKGFKAATEVLKAAGYLS
tara:strand:+ start:60 stop:557 length:498 start_codon:yes stop_codon:yes gene_type:complete